jgi:hypothetical protein
LRHSVSIVEVGCNRYGRNGASTGTSSASDIIIGICGHRRILKGIVCVDADENQRPGAGAGYTLGPRLSDELGIPVGIKVGLRSTVASLTSRASENRPQLRKVRWRIRRLI